MDQSTLDRLSRTDGYGHSDGFGKGVEKVEARRKRLAYLGALMAKYTETQAVNESFLNHVAEVEKIKKETKELENEAANIKVNVDALFERKGLAGADQDAAKKKFETLDREKLALELQFSKKELRVVQSEYTSIFKDSKKIASAEHVDKLFENLQQDVKAGVGSKVLETTILESIKEAAKSVSKDVQTETKGLKATSTKVLSAIEDISKLLSSAKDDREAAKASEKEAWETLIEGISTQLSTLNDGYTAKVKEVGDAITERFDKEKEEATAIHEDSKKGLTTINSALNQAKEQLTTARNDVIEKIGEESATTRESFGGLNDKLDKARVDFAITRIQVANGLKAVNESLEGAKETANVIQNKVAEGLKLVDETIDGVKETIQTEVRALSNGFPAAISSGLKNVDSSLSTIQTAIDSVATDLTSTKNDFMSAISTGISEASTKIEGSVANLASGQSVTELKRIVEGINSSVLNIPTKEGLGEFRKKTVDAVSDVVKVAVIGEQEVSKLRVEVVELRSQADALQSRFDQATKEYEAGSNKAAGDINKLESEKQELSEQVKTLHIERKGDATTLQEEKEARAREVVELKEEFNAKIKDIETQHATQVANLEREYQIEKTAVATKFSTDLVQISKELNDGFATSLSKVEGLYNDRAAELAAKHEQACKVLQNDHSEALNQAKAAHDQETTQLRQKHSDETTKLAENHRIELGKVKSEYQEEHDREMTRLRQSQEAALDTVRLEHDREIARLKQSQEAALGAARDEHADSLRRAKSDLQEKQAQEIAAIQDTLDEVCGERDQLSSNLVAVKEQLQAAQSKHDVLSRQNSSLSAEVEDGRGRITALETENAQITASRDQALMRIDELEGIKTGLGDDLRVANSKIASLQGDLTTREKDYKDLDTRFASISQHAEGLDTENKRLSGELDVSTERIVSLNSEVEKLNQEALASTERIVGLDGEVEKLNQEASVSSQRILTLEGEAANGKKLSDELSELVVELRGNLFNANERVSSLEQDAIKMTGGMKQKDTDLTKAAEEMSRLQQAIEDEKKVSNAFVDDVVALQGTINNLRSFEVKCTELQNRVDRIEVSREDIKKERDSLRENNERLIRERDEQVVSNNSLRGRLDTLDSELQRVVQKRDDLQRHMDAIIPSTPRETIEEDLRRQLAESRERVRSQQAELETLRARQAEGLARGETQRTILPGREVWEQVSTENAGIDELPHLSRSFSVPIQSTRHSPDSFTEMYGGKRVRVDASLKSRPSIDSTLNPEAEEWIPQVPTATKRKEYNPRWVPAGETEPLVRQSRTQAQPVAPNTSNRRIIRPVSHSARLSTASPVAVWMGLPAPPPSTAFPGAIPIRQESSRQYDPVREVHDQQPGLIRGMEIPPLTEEDRRVYKEKHGVPPPGFTIPPRTSSMAAPVVPSGVEIPPRTSSSAIQQSTAIPSTQSSSGVSSSATTAQTGFFPPGRGAALRFPQDMPIAVDFVEVGGLQGELVVDGIHAGTVDRIDAQIADWDSRGPGLWDRGGSRRQVCVNVKWLGGKASVQGDQNPQYACAVCVAARVPCIRSMKDGRPRVLPLPFADRGFGATPKTEGFYMKM